MSNYERNIISDFKVRDSNAFHIIESDDFSPNKITPGCEIDSRRAYVGLPILKFANFDLGYNNLESDSNTVSRFNCKLKCPMCHGSSSSFYCSECVHNGNFYHSTVKFPERFAEKRLRERRLRQYISSLEKKAPEQVSHLLKRESMKNEIELLKERIHLTKKVIENERSKILKAREEENRLRFQTLHLQKAHPGFFKKNKNIMLNIHLYEERIPDKKDQISELEDEFKQLVRGKIENLTSTIFPMSEITPELTEPITERQDSVNEETVKELAEALQTHYVRGKWITSSHFSPVKNYSLLSMVLPGSGDYASFIRPQNSLEIDEKKESLNVCAGLTYLCQMVNVVAYYLGVNLPKRVSFREFISQEEMSQWKFQRLVLRLNSNVIYLCVSQGVPSNLLHPLRALPNLMALLNREKSDLGRQGSFDFVESILDTLEEAGSYENLPDSDSDEDWETFPSLALPECLPPAPSGMFFRRASVDETASGIVTSAAASVMSMFRGIGNPMK